MLVLFIRIIFILKDVWAFLFVVYVGIYISVKFFEEFGKLISYPTRNSSTFSNVTYACITNNYVHHKIGLWYWSVLYKLLNTSRRCLGYK